MPVTPSKLAVSRLSFVLAFAVVIGCAATSTSPAPPSAPLDTRPAASTLDAGSPGVSASASPGQAEGAPPQKVTLSEACITPDTRARVSACPAMTGPPPTQVDVLDAESAANNEARRSTPKAPNGRGGDKARLARKTPGPLEAKAIATTRAYVCANPNDDDTFYSYARMHFELNDWEGAAELFGRVANGPPERDMTMYGAQLMLEALNVLATTFKRTECLTDLERAVPMVRARLCTPTLVAKGNREQCETLAKIDADIAHRNSTSTN